MAQVKTTISINGDVLKETDNIARELEIPRSKMVSLALIEFNKHYRNNQILQQINDAYASPPSPDETENEALMKSHFKNLEGGNEWK